MDEAASRVRMEQEEPSEELKSLEEKINALSKDKDAAINAQDFEKAAQLRDIEKDYKEQVEIERDKRRKNNQEHRDVNAEDIAAVVSGWTGIPVTRLTEDEGQRLLHMEDILHKRVVGQDEAVKAVARAIRRGRVGLKDPKTGEEPYAVVQLRKDNADGTIYNLVGFQTHLRFPEQKRVFSMIPALHDAKFLRYGVMHRNTYLDSPRLLDRYYRLKAMPRIAFAGQMTGVEGYVESCASGFLAGVETARRLLGQAPMDFPRETAIGALGLYVSNESVTQFQPMNINFGIMPPLDHRVKGKRNKNAELSQRSLAIIEQLKQEVLNYEDHH